MNEKRSGECEYCGHIRYTNDLFNGACVPCVLWAEDQINALTRQLAAANERAGRLEVALNKLVTVTNGVTAPHRHNAPISMKHLDRLCEVQLDCERILGGPL